MRNGTSAATRGRRSKKIILTALEKHISRAFNESIVEVAREHPKGWAFPFWFGDVLRDYASRYPRRQKRRAR